ncbi:hypothetical protein IKG49_02775 [Candidatus Saccharibacteria bacterium]|nr:hypothetical protein [Candidatus Saccharibacteria bacterium]
MHEIEKLRLVILHGIEKLTVVVSHEIGKLELAISLVKTWQNRGEILGIFAEEYLVK